MNQQKRVRPKPKYGKYIYEYLFNLNDEKDLIYVGKNKYYICYRDGMRIYFKPKNPITRMKELSHYEIGEITSEVLLQVHQRLLKSKSLFYIVYRKIYSYDNLSTDDIIKMMPGSEK